MATLRAASTVRFADKVRVLVIDDYADYRRAMTVLLRLSGYEVMDAANGQLGLETCRTWAPSIVLVDCDMPVMNGLEFLAAKSRDQTIAAIPVVMISASDVDVLGKVARRLTKPVAPTVVLATLSALVASR